MFAVAGTRLFGRTQAYGGSYVATRFVHVNGFILVPRGSFLVVPDGVRTASVPLGVHGPSLLLGFARSWGVWAAIVGAIVAFCGISGNAEAGDSGQLVSGLVVAVVGAACASAGFLAGRISAREAAARRVYAHFAGVPIDVAALARSKKPPAVAWTERLRARCLEVIEAESRVAGQFGYRSLEGGSAADWAAIAVAPEVEHVPFLRAALTLARLDEPRVSSSAGNELARVHGIVLDRLQALGACEVPA